MEKGRDLVGDVGESDFWDDAEDYGPANGDRASLAVPKSVLKDDRGA